MKHTVPQKKNVPQKVGGVRRKSSHSGKLRRDQATYATLGMLDFNSENLILFMGLPIYVSAAFVSRIIGHCICTTTQAQQITVLFPEDFPSAVRGQEHTRAPIGEIYGICVDL